MTVTARAAAPRWAIIALDRNGSGIAFRNVRGQIIDLALENPELSPRERAVRFTNERRFFLSPKRRSIGC